MSETHSNKKLATLMCVIFATNLVALLYGIYGGAIMYDFGLKVFNIGNIILDVPIIVCAFIIASKKNLFLTNSAKCASWVYFGLQTFSLFNILCYTIFDNNIPSIIGPTSHIIFPLILACSAVWFYASLHMWMLVKIFGIISALPAIVSGILLYQVVGKDYSDDLLPIFDAIGTTAIISVVLYAVALFLSIVWAFRKPIAPHVQSTPLDII